MIKKLSVILNVIKQQRQVSSNNINGIKKINQFKMYGNPHMQIK